MAAPFFTTWYDTNHGTDPNMFYFFICNKIYSIQGQVFRPQLNIWIIFFSAVQGAQLIYHSIDGIAKSMSWRNVTPVMTMIPVYRPPLVDKCFSMLEVFAPLHDIAALHWLHTAAFSSRLVKWSQSQTSRHDAAALLLEGLSHRIDSDAMYRNAKFRENRKTSCREMRDR